MVKNKKLFKLLLKKHKLSMASLASEIGVTTRWLRKVINQDAEGHRTKLLVADRLNVKYTDLWTKPVNEG